MKRYLISALLTVAAVAAFAQGWPAGYGGVMLQGFYWDSFSDSKWTKLTEQADELAPYFDIIWVPQSGQTSDGPSAQQMGYSPCYWLNHNTIFGTEAELRTMINTFKAKGTGIMEDVVINHKNGYMSWVYFPNESKNGYSISWDNTNYSGICRSDECNSNGYTTTGANDTGDDFDGLRDLDHTNSTVQDNIITYLNFLLNDLGYCGFRYDMVKGYDAIYSKKYTNAAKPTYSVGECYDFSYDVVRNWIVRGGYSSAAFDFPLKNKINSAFSSNSWSYLNSGGLAHSSTFNQYSVTFVENHDTDRDQAAFPNANRILGANAYILAMPGTPCVFLKHWKKYKGEISRMILARKAAGVTNTSAITSQGFEGSSYVVKVQGTNGTVMCVLGPSGPVNIDGFRLISSSTSSGNEYAYYVSANITVGEGIVSEIPDEATWQSDAKYFAYFEAPSSWTTVAAWAWNTNNYTGGTWPGQVCAKIATLSNGKNLWLWTYTGSYTTPPSSIIFNNNNNGSQTSDLEFVNAGYYDSEGTLVGTVEEFPEDDPAINVYVRSSADNLHIYGWDTSGIVTAAWPGDAVTETSSIYNEVWNFYQFKNRTSINLILNNGKDTYQTGDITDVTGDIFLEFDLVNESWSNITAAVTGIEELPNPDAITVYVKKTSDNGPYIYAWDNSGAFPYAWPGYKTSSKKSLHNSEWYYHTYDINPLNVILNMGDNNTQTVDIKNITHNIYLEYNSSNKSYTDVTNSVTDNGGNSSIPSGTVYVINTGGFVYFEAPSYWVEPIYSFAWNSSSNFTGEWPGTEMKYVSTTSKGNKVYFWSLPAPAQSRLRSSSSEPTYIIFSDSNHIQTDDFPYVSAGYYNAAYNVGTVPDTVTGVDSVTATAPADNRVFSIDGRYLGTFDVIGASLQPGFYIIGGRKVLK